MQIRNDLLKAYKGYYETEIEREYKPAYADYCQQAVKDGLLEVPTFDHWVTFGIKRKIEQHTPKERLEVYLEWNGIIGYANRAFEIATGEL